MKEVGVDLSLFICFPVSGPEVDVEIKLKQMTDVVLSSQILKINLPCKHQVLTVMKTFPKGGPERI